MRYILELKTCRSQASGAEESTVTNKRQRTTEMKPQLGQDPCCWLGGPEEWVNKETSITEKETSGKYLHRVTVQGRDVEVAKAAFQAGS